MAIHIALSSPLAGRPSSPMHHQYSSPHLSTRVEMRSVDDNSLYIHIQREHWRPQQETDNDKWICKYSFKGTTLFDRTFMRVAWNVEQETLSNEPWAHTTIQIQPYGVKIQKSMHLYGTGSWSFIGFTLMTQLISRPILDLSVGVCSASLPEMMLHIT